MLAADDGEGRPAPALLTCEQKSGHQHDTHLLGYLTLRVGDKITDAHDGVPAKTCKDVSPGVGCFELTMEEGGEEASFRDRGTMTCQDVHDALHVCDTPSADAKEEDRTQHAYYMGKCPVTCAAARNGHASVADAVAAGMLRQVGEDVYLDVKLHGIGVPDMCPAACGIGCGYAPKQDMADNTSSRPRPHWDRP